MAQEPFLGVPAGNVRVENPDGVFQGSPSKHNLYDRTPPLEAPLIPGDYDNCRDIRSNET